MRPMLGFWASMSLLLRPRNAATRDVRLDHHRGLVLVDGLDVTLHLLEELVVLLELLGVDCRLRRQFGRRLCLGRSVQYTLVFLARRMLSQFTLCRINVSRHQSADSEHGSPHGGPQPCVRYAEATLAV